MSLKRKLALYTLISSLVIVILYSLTTYFVVNQIIKEEAKNEYVRIQNIYTLGRNFGLVKDEFENDPLEAFKELSIFIKRVYGFELIFIYDIVSLKRVIDNIEEFLKGKSVIENYILEGDLIKDEKLKRVIINTDAYSIYGNPFSPIFIYSYPISYKESIIGKVVFLDHFSFDHRFIVGLYLFLVFFTLLNAYLPVRFFSRIVEELRYLSELTREFSQKEFSKIDDLRKSIRQMKGKDELYLLKVSLLKMVEALEQYIRRLREEVESYESMAFTDPLTGLYNRRMFLELARKKFNEAKRYHEPFSVVMLDIDHFKKINDTYGHDVGDIALKFLADILKKNIRGSDIVARWGGEEFIILLPKTNLENAFRVAEKIRKLVEMSEIKLPTGQRLKFTVSLGISTYHGHEDLEELIKEADIALYAAKRKGRNRVEVYKSSLSL